jgi:hypothetical protein
MENVESLLGIRYADLSTVSVFAGTPVPTREVVVDQSYVSFPKLGISLVLSNNETVSAVQLHTDRHEGFIGFAHALPKGIEFRMNRSAVRAILGTPEKSGEEKEVLLLGKKPAWDSFKVDGIRLHVEYSQGGGGIQLLTFTSL